MVDAFAAAWAVRHGVEVSRAFDQRIYALRELSPAEPVPGVGLESMHHRAQAAGGHLEVRSPVGTGRRGTVVEARLPTRGLP